MQTVVGYILKKVLDGPGWWYIPVMSPDEEPELRWPKDGGWPGLYYSDGSCAVKFNPQGVEPKKVKKIYIDMDGVLADFDGWKREISRTHPEVNDDHQGLWEAVKKVDHFYYHLELMPEALRLYRYLSSLGIPMEILTAIPRRNVIPFSEGDKLLWVRELIDPEIPFNIGPYAIDKQNFAQPGYVLIDDNPLNIDQWNAKGGWGILYKDLKTTMEELSQLL